MKILNSKLTNPIRILWNSGWLMDGAMIITIMMGLICIFGKVSRTFEDATYIMLIWFGMYLLVDGIRKKESLFPVLIYGGGVIILLFRLFRVPGW